MKRPVWLVLLTVATATVAYGADAKLDLSTIDRAIHRQPAYIAEPRYALLLVGPRGEHRAWLVIDGNEIAYLDRNGNGDLTEKDERIPLDRDATDAINVGPSNGVLAMNVFKLGELAGCQLTFQLWVRDPAYDAAKDERFWDYPEMVRSLRDMRTLNLENGSLYRAAKSGMQAQIPLALTAKPEDAQACHLMGPLTFALKWGKRQRLEPWPKSTVFDVHIGTRGLPPRGWSHDGFDFAPLTTSKVPEGLHPVASFAFPPAEASGPLAQELTLNERCCGDTFYAHVRVPQVTKTGDAKVTVNFPAWLGHKVAPADFNVSIDQDRSDGNEAVYVLFRDADIELKHAVNALRKAALNVAITEGRLLVSTNGAEQIAVRLTRGPEIGEIARGLAGGTPFVSELQRCDARFEIGPYRKGNEESIKQIELLLQKLTNGYAYHTWDQRLIARK